MRNVPDGFLLEIAGISASLLGFFVIGVFFYVQRGLFPQAADIASRYMQAATRVVILLYGMTMSLSLALVVMTDGWVAIFYLALSLLLIASVVRMSIVVSRLHRLIDIRVMSRVAIWSAAGAIVTFPWIVGGFQPGRSDLAAAVLLIGSLAFMSSASLVLSTFAIARLESSAAPPQDDEDHIAPAAARLDEKPNEKDLVLSEGRRQ
jgi:hypothetical protein